MIVNIYIEGNKIDLFEDETISITQGVQDVKDISKLFADYSQSFSVPASKNNNALFKHYYNQDIDDGFDARTRKAGLININTLPFKTGKIQLNGVKIENGVAASYNLTFFGDVIKVKDLIGDDKLAELEWLDNFDHEYSDVIVKEGLTDGLDFTVDGTLYERAIIYPLISYATQYFYSSDTNVDTLNEAVNIAYTAGRTEGVKFNELKPAIKLSLIIDAIKEKYGFNFVGGFFESQLFKDIYVNLNNSTESLANGIVVVDERTVPTTAESSRRNDLVKYFAKVTPVDDEIGYKIRITMNGIVKYETTNFLYGTKERSGTVTTPTSETSVKFEVLTEQDFDFDASAEFYYSYGIANIETIAPYPLSFPSLSINLESVIKNLIKDIKTYSFLTSMFKTFNLVVVQSGEDIKVEDLQTWYIEGNIIDVTPYIDTRTKEVDRGVIFKEIDFKFEESDQILADEFNQTNNRGFGDDTFELYTDESQTEKLEGKTLKIESIFENPVFERLLDLNNNDDTSIMYCPYFNRDIKSISGNPFMLYGISTDVSSNPIGFEGAGSSYDEINTSVIMPSHTRQIDVESFGLNFHAEFNEYTGNLNEDNIISRFYLDYITDIFSNKRRTYKFKAILPYSILNTLKLNDRLIIGNTRYIINKMTSNLTKREDSLELINDIYDAPLASDLSNNSIFIPSSGFYQTTRTQDSTQYIGVDTATLSKVDTGDGVTWFDVFSTITSAISTVDFEVAKNETGATRTGIIKATDGLNDPTFIITQEGTPLVCNITAD